MTNPQTNYIFEDDIVTTPVCTDPGHNPPTFINIPKGKRYHHVCPTCKWGVMLRGEAGVMSPEHFKTSFMEHFDSGHSFFESLTLAFGNRHGYSRKLENKYKEVVAVLRGLPVSDMKIQMIELSMQEGIIHVWQNKASREVQRALAAELKF